MQFSPNNKKIIIISLIALLIVLSVIASVFVFSSPKTASGNHSMISSKQSIITESVTDAPVVSQELASKVTPKKVQTEKNTAALKEKVESIKPTKENTINLSASININDVKATSAVLNVKFLAQNPELPTGCEITSLTTVLNYYGFNVNKLTMANDYLQKENAPANFWNVFLGDPTKKTGFGCYAQPIVNAANKYLLTQGSTFVAKNISGTTFESLLNHVSNGRPVVIWGTMEMRKPYKTYKWKIDGKTIEWISPEHCLVLIGYNLNKGIAIMSDPQNGIVSYNINTVKSRYIALHSQCVILEDVKPEPAPPQIEESQPAESQPAESQPAESSSTESNTFSSDISSFEDNSSKEQGSSSESYTSSDNNSSSEDNSSNDNNSSQEDTSSENSSTAEGNNSSEDSSSQSN